jgi:homoserine dehydrogenase
LIAHAFGVVAKPNEIFNLGIDRLGDLELNYAREKGLKIKLVAYAEKASNGKIKAFVLPKFVHKSDKLFNVDDVFNGVKTKSYFSDTQFFVGKGAGAYPTASAVLSDISALTYDYRYEYKKLNLTESLETDNHISLRILLRHNLLNGPIFEKHFEEINESYRNQESGYTIGTISLKGLKEIVAYQAPDSSIILCDVCSAKPLEIA